MEEIRNIYLRHLQGRLSDIALEVTRVRYASARRPEAWHPAMNAYRCRDGFLICAELAGVERSQISLRVEPGRVVLQGRRPPPEPRAEDGPPLQVLAMEIDQGFFTREIVLPAEVEPDGVRAEQEGGVLRIWLPLALPP